MRQLSRLKFRVYGRVQGVGYRPFVYREALRLNLKGFVKNTNNYVEIEVEGEQVNIDLFARRLLSDAPIEAHVDRLESVSLTPKNYDVFEILSSTGEGGPYGEIGPDIAACHSCLEETLDPNNRRYRYALNSCAHCGPRYSIIDSLPFDRSNTSMRDFSLCPACEREYCDPKNRRFHAQTISCHACGPKLSFLDQNGRLLAEDQSVLMQAADALRRGAIIAIKGVGGFQLCVDARSDAAVQELRRRKQRRSKPFAVMFGELSSVTEVCFLSNQEEKILNGPVRPIVLLKLKSQKLSGALAPDLAWLGVMLPAMPLHYLLLKELGFPIVATSANISDQPMIADENLALSQLNGIADYFLIHDREIIWPIDDSVVRVVYDRALMLRHARGYAPAYVKVSDLTAGILGAGGYLKNTISYSYNHVLFHGPHIGDLATPEARRRHDQQIDRLTRQQEIGLIFAGDMHPDVMAATCVQAEASVAGVQHHVAHIVSCLVDNGLVPPVLGVAWDGAGVGDDGRLWGGEFLKISKGAWRRVGHMRGFSLPGGALAFEEPRRAAIGLLFEIYGDSLFSMSEFLPLAEFSALEKMTLQQMLKKDIQINHTTSVGRIFDAFAALLGVCQRASYEGQAAAMLESLAQDAPAPKAYTCKLEKSFGDMLVVDWEPVLRHVLIDWESGCLVNDIAAGIHIALADAVVSVASALQETRVALSGGCFQNAYLTQAVVASLQQNGFEPFWHQNIPPNDGGLAVGQAVWTSWRR